MGGLNSYRNVRSDPIPFPHENTPVEPSIGKTRFVHKIPSAQARAGHARASGLKFSASLISSSDFTSFVSRR